MAKIFYESFNFSKKRLALIDTANGIIEDYVSDGYVLTLRQLYYQFVARGLLENNFRNYKNLGNAISDGRRAGLIDWNHIEDRGRGLSPWLIEEDAQEVVNGLEYGFALDFWEPQNVYVEVWPEKDALSSVIERPCSEWRVPYMACKGYLSDSEAWAAGRRFRSMLNNGRRCVLIHLGDHDPSGVHMTVDNENRIDMFSGFPGGVEIHRIALNMDQVREYNPPANPLKIKANGELADSRALDYMIRFGEESWELDALEPRVLHELIEDEIKSLIDMDLWERTNNNEAEQREILSRFYSEYDNICQFLRSSDQG